MLSSKFDKTVLVLQSSLDKQQLGMVESSGSVWGSLIQTKNRQDKPMAPQRFGSSFEQII